MTENEKEKTEIQKAIIPVNGRGLVLANLTDMYRFAQYVVKSALAPSSFRTPEQILIAMQTGAELSMPPMRSLQSLCVVKGQARLWGDAPLALVRQSGHLEYIKERIEGEGENMVAYCETKRKGDPEPVCTTFSVADAKVAGLWGKRGKQSGEPTPWVTYPKRMLKYRARSFNLRDNFPDCFGGATIAEEYEGVQTPTEQPTPQVLSRDERKQVDSVAVKEDSKAVLTDELNKLLIDFRRYAEHALETDLAEISGPVWNRATADFAARILNDDTDYGVIYNYTLPKITQLAASLQENGIPETALLIIQDALADTPMTEEEATAHAEDILGDHKYKCTNCGLVFDKEPEKKKGKLQCIECLKLTVEELTETAAKE